MHLKLTVVRRVRETSLVQFPLAITYNASFYMLQVSSGGLFLIGVYLAVLDV